MVENLDQRGESILLFPNIGSALSPLFFSEMNITAFTLWYRHMCDRGMVYGI